MKKILTTLLILSCIYSVSQAQTANTTQLGFNIGYNASTISDPQTGQTGTYTSGFNAGFSAEYYFSDRWSIKGKLIYDQKGWGDGYFSENSDGENGPSEVTFTGLDYHLSYITVPLMANWHFGRKRNWYLNFGPYVGFLLNAHATSPDPQFNVDDALLKSAFNSVDAGVALGIGVKFPITDKVSLFLEDDGQAGISHLFKDNSNGNAQSVRSALNIGFVFSVK